VQNGERRWRTIQNFQKQHPFFLCAIHLIISDKIYTCGIYSWREGRKSCEEKKVFVKSYLYQKKVKGWQLIENFEVL
jgi:hypothetical protein